MAKRFDYQAAKQEGYSDEEISGFLKEQHPKFNYDAALQEGHTPEEINQFLSDYKEEKPLAVKAGRVGAQLAMGSAEMAMWPYEIAVAPLASKEAQTLAYRQGVMEDIERIQDLKDKGLASDWELELLPDLINQIKNYEESAKYSQTADLGIRKLTEKITGIDFQPEGILEHAANWIGMIKDPTKFKDIYKTGLKPSNILDSFGLTKTTLLRGGLAGTALEMAKEGNFGPVGTISAAVVADVLGHGPKAIYEVGKDIIKHPKEYLAKGINLVTGQNSKKEWVKQLVQDANEMGIQLDAGTLTDSNWIRMVQARAAQSALSGKALENFQKDMSQQFVKQWQDIIEHLGEIKFSNSTEAGNAIQKFIKNEKNTLFQDFGPREAPPGRPLRGRVNVQAEPEYEQQLLNSISPQEVHSTAQGGLNLKTAAEDIKAPLKEDIGRRWENLNRQLDETQPIIMQPELENALGSFLENHRGSILLGESSAEFKVYQDALRLFESIQGRNVAGVGSSLRELIKTKRTLADIADFEFGGSNFESAYKHLVGVMDRAIESSIQAANPELMPLYRQLNAETEAFKAAFENRNVMPLFQPRNEDYNRMWESFVNNPDKLRALDDILFMTPRGQEMLNQVKRDFARKEVSRQNFTERDARDLIERLGPDFEQPVMEYMQQRNQARLQQAPRPEARPRLGMEVPLGRPTGVPLSGKKIGTTFEHERKKLYEYIAKKDPEQIMNMMNNVSDIRKLKKALSLTNEGKQLFDELSRYKVAEMIDRNMMDKVGENIRLNKFSSLINSSKDQAVLKELIGKEAFDQFQKLQKIGSRMAESQMKFYNASKSGTSLIDVGIAGSFFTGFFTGNPYLMLKSLVGLGSLQVPARLFTNPEFLKLLEEAALTGGKPNSKKFIDILKKMEPMVKQAMGAATLEEMSR